MSEPITVLVVDDHPGFRSAASALVDATEGLEMVGSAGAASEARLVLAAGDPPGLILMDINLGDDSGIDLTRSIVEASPEIRVVLVSTLQPDELPRGAATCGAVGYIPKSKLSPDTLHEALQRA